MRRDQEELTTAKARVMDLREQLEAVRNWARQSLNLHQPYVSGRVDVSCTLLENMKADLAKQIERNLFCTACSTPWPCKQIGPLRLLRSITSNGHDLGAALQQIEEMRPRERVGVIETGL